ncbi:hypothetical protein BN903_221 [Halorubrum sp. AJ67]|nr:hypothetical protein BN903_221 [Halorubrum sp. AJ67]
MRLAVSTHIVTGTGLLQHDWPQSTVLRECEFTACLMINFLFK